MVLGHDISSGERTQDIEISQNVSFDTMLLAEETQKGLSKSGFLKPSPIQLRGIPLGKCGFDLLLEAKSGTGKTAVFGVIALEKLDLSKGVQTIILAPTREIASQICDVINTIGAFYKGLNVAVVMGGLPVQEDIEKFQKNVHIVVGSPGRLRHLIQDKHIDVSSVRLFVLDEADKLLEQSFLCDINCIFCLLPKVKQVIMASATFIEETKKFIGKYVKKAQHVCPDSNSILLGIAQKVIILPFNSNITKQTQTKYEELKKILSSKVFKQCLIFCNYQRRVTQLHKLLNKDKWPSTELYGLQDQLERLEALKTLQDYRCRILISTDLAARGIDASNVDLIVNFEIPYEWQTYLHRIGRAGRYGSYGTAVSILCKGEETTKFINTLAHTNISFNLRDFWSDEPLNMTATADCNNANNDTSAPVTTTSENNLQECQSFTIDLSEQKSVIKQEILSFEELCDSFQKSTIDVDEANTETERFTYKPLKINKVPVVSGDSNLSNKYSKQGFKSQNSNSEMLSTENQQFNELDLSSFSGDEIEIKCNKLNDFKDEELQSDDDVKDSYKYANHFGKKSNDSKYDATQQALIDAGLPTSFGKIVNKKLIKRKFKKHESDNNIEKKTDNNRVKHTTKTNHYNDKEIKKIDGHDIKSNNKKSNYQLHVDDNEDSDSSLNSNYKQKIRNNSKRTQNFTYDVNTNNINQFYSDKMCTRLRISNKVKPRSKEFDNWYNQLRMQSQFIQNALYIEELRNL